MKILLAILLAVLTTSCAGCGIVSPEPRDARTAWLESAEVPPPTHASLAIDIVTSSLEGVTGTRTRVTVRWWSGDWLPVGSANASGIALSCDNIWVWTDGSDKIGGVSPLAHEIGHCARSLWLGSNDASHSDVSWWSGPVNDAATAISGL